MAGRVKIRLAKVLEQRLEEMGHTATVDPDRLVYQPNGGSIFADWATWRGQVVLDGRDVDICSWDSMQQCCKGVDLSIGGYRQSCDIEAFAEDS